MTASITSEEELIQYILSNSDGKNVLLYEVLFGDALSDTHLLTLTDEWLVKHWDWVKHHIDIRIVHRPGSTTIRIANCLLWYTTPGDLAQPLIAQLAKGE